MSPATAFHGMYPYPVAHPYDTYSQVDWEEPETQYWPAATQVPGAYHKHVSCHLHDSCRHKGCGCVQVQQW